MVLIWFIFSLLSSRPSPHSPASNEAFGGGGHSYYPSGYYSPQVGQMQDSSPSATVQRKDSESSNSDGSKGRKEKSSCSISPTSSAPPSVKEPNLMPVPSPQQIQYLNVFEGQELTIQKQPNVGLSEHNNQNSPGYLFYYLAYAFRFDCLLFFFNNLRSLV